MKVLLAGATGLVGRHCVARLLADPRVTQLSVMQRRAGPGPAGARLVQADFEQLDDVDADEFAVDVAFCALGTTIRIARSQAAFRRVDHDYVVDFARRAHAGGARRFGLVSAVGADPTSRLFYNRVKGETEAAIARTGFETLVIVQPSLLLGERDESRPGERLAAPLGRWLPRRWRAVPAGRVAAGLIDATLGLGAGVHRITNAALVSA